MVSQLLKTQTLRCAVPFVLFLGVSDAPASPSIEDARAQFEEHTNMCTEAHAYDTAQSAQLGEYELGSGELAWRSCVYAGIRQLMVPSSEVPEVYLNLIDEDRHMTDAIIRKVMTRAQRRHRVEELLAIIDESEAQARETLITELEAARERLYALQQKFDRMRTIQQMQAPLLQASSSERLSDLTSALFLALKITCRRVRAKTVVSHLPLRSLCPTPISRC